MGSEGVLTLTALTGRPLRSADGRAAGVVRDLTVRLSGERPRVEQILVARRGQRELVPWSAVAFEGDCFVLLGPHHEESRPLNRPRHDANELDLGADELLLARDVLDCQIVDLRGRRMTRASDVLLSRIPEGGLALLGVEVGLGAVLRRLGLGWLGGRLRRQVVPVDQLHLSSARGHQVQLAVSSSAVYGLETEDLSQLLTRLDVAKATDVIVHVGPERAAKALLRSHPIVGRRLLSALPAQESSRVRRHLPPATAVSHPHLHAGTSPARRRMARLDGWRTHRPPEASA